MQDDEKTLDCNGLHLDSRLLQFLSNLLDRIRGRLRSLLNLGSLVLLGLLLLRGGVLGKLLGKWDEVRSTGQVFAEGLRYPQTLVWKISVLVHKTQTWAIRGETHVLGLIVLHDAAHGAGGSAKRGVEAVDVALLEVRLLLAAVPYLKVTGLVVGTVGARDELLVLTPKWHSILVYCFARTQGA